MKKYCDRNFASNYNCYHLGQVHQVYQQLFVMPINSLIKCARFIALESLCSSQIHIVLILTAGIHQHYRCRHSRSHSSRIDTILCIHRGNAKQATF